MPGSCVWGLSAHFHDYLLVIRTAHDHVALHGIVDAENAIELGDLSGVSVEFFACGGSVQVGVCGEVLRLLRHMHSW